ncbi:MAG: YciI family protein [Ilumatobacter sp.]|uniref:YciI family protein n=1 Tax=Ilumatobacter sp. TaxID=1967498 RepID=UPI0026177FB7|nr:YciI family protein [Ilumatobacter sp.]MDJ0767950.1 YciI family protein [Ilumatobacter sp.]
MSQYLLSVHSVEGAARPDMTPEEMEASMSRVMALEAEMKECGAFLFGGALADPGSATVVRSAGDEMVMTDGPFAEAKEHIGGFYIIDAADLDAALEWAGKVVDCIKAPIEVRPFQHVSG